MDFSYLKRPSYEQVGVWGVTTLLTGWVVWRRPELFLNPETNLSGIVLASAINGLFLTFSHNALKEYFRPKELIDPQLEKQRVAYQMCDEIGRERARTSIEHHKAQSNYAALSREKGTQAQEQQGRVEVAQQRRKSSMIQLATARNQLSDAAEKHRIKSTKIFDSEQEIIHRKQTIAEKESSKSEIALSVAAARKEIIRIQQELTSTTKEFRRLEKEAPNLDEQTRAMQDTLREMAERLETRRLEEQTKTREHIELSAELKELEQREKEFKIPLNQIELELVKQKRLAFEIQQKLSLPLQYLKKLLLNVCNIPGTAEECSRLILWVMQTLEVQEADIGGKKIQDTEITKIILILKAQKEEVANKLRVKINELRTNYPSKEELERKKEVSEKRTKALEYEYEKYLEELTTNIKICKENYENKKSSEPKLETISLDDIDAGNFDRSYYDKIKAEFHTLTSTTYYNKIDGKKISLSPEQKLMFFKHEFLKAEEALEKSKENIRYLNFHHSIENLLSLKKQIAELNDLNENIDTFKIQIRDLDVEIIEKTNLIRDLQKEIVSHQDIIDWLKQISVELLEQLKKHYETIQELEKQKEKSTFEQLLITVRIDEIKRKLQSIEKVLETINTKQLQKTFEQEDQKYKILLEDLIKIRIFLETTGSSKDELELNEKEAIKQAKALEIKLSFHEAELKRLIREYEQKVEKHKVESNYCDELSSQANHASERVQALEKEYEQFDAEYIEARRMLTELNSRLGVNFASAKQIAESSRDDWKQSALDYRKALDDHEELEYSLRMYQLLSKEINVLLSAINALEAQKTYSQEKSNNPDSVLIASYRHDALQIERKHLKLQIKHCRAQHLLAKCKRENEEYQESDPENVLKAYQDEQLLYYRLNYYLEKLFQHDKMVQWEEEIDRDVREKLQIQIQDSIDRQTHFQKMRILIQHTGFEIQETGSFRKEFKLRKTDLSPCQDDLAILSLISLIEKCLIDYQPNILDIIGNLVENPSQLCDMEQENSQSPLRSILEIVTKKKQTISDKVAEAFALMQQKVQEIFKDQEQVNLLEALEECRKKAEPFHAVKELLIAPLNGIDLENDPEEMKKYCIKTLIQYADQGIRKIEQDITEIYQELQHQFRDLFVHKPQLRFLIAKLELLQKNQELFFKQNNRDLVRDVCNLQITIADILKEKKSIKLERMKQALENQTEILGKPPIKEDSHPNRIYEAAFFIFPQILLLLLYKMKFITNLLKNVNADIGWSAAWKTSIWTFAIHHQTSYLLECDRKV